MTRERAVYVINRDTFSNPTKYSDREWDYPEIRRYGMCARKPVPITRG